jgi:TetR/AcrR family transcriptional regulator, ethionamide resistance regulator
VTAAESLLRERPFRDLTVDEVMRRTELSRPSFYVYFRDRHHLVLKVVERIQSEMLEIASTWFRGGRDGPMEIRVSLEGIVVAYRTHGPVLRALSDASTEDPRVEQFYGAMMQTYTSAVAEHIAAEQQAGKALACLPEETATALVLMIERYLLRELTWGPVGAQRETQVVDVLCTILTRTIYGRDAEPAGPH